MKEEEYSRLVEKLKINYFLESDIEKDYTFKIKDNEFKSILGYAVTKNTVEISAFLVIFQKNKLDIDYIFKQTKIICIINIRNNNKYNIYLRDKIEEYKKSEYFPNFYEVASKSMKFTTLLFLKTFQKLFELFFVQFLIAILSIFIPPLSKKLWEYYKDPLKRVIRKKDVDRVPHWE